MQTAVAIALYASLFGQGTERVDFDKAWAGGMPPFWAAAETHAGPPPRWEIVVDKTAPSRKNVFAQVSPSGRENEFALAVFDKVICRDGDLSVKFKITGGRDAKTAGIVWRYQDPNNYYVLEFSADQHRMSFIRVQNGESKTIPITSGKALVQSLAHDMTAGQWYVARVSFRGEKIRVSFGNRLLFEASDASLSREGKTGLWTRAGTQAQFDDFRIDKKG